MTVTLHHGDALAVMATLPAQSVQLVATDPPYYRVKGEAWDRQWDNPEAFLAWIGKCCDEWRRILTPNGSLYVFASTAMAARVECVVAERFHVLNRITWAKPEGWHKGAEKEVLRSYFPASEAIIFAEPGADGYGGACDNLRGTVFESIRAYLDGERRRAGVNFEAVRQAVGCASGSGLPSHWFTRSQWMLPTAEHYAALQRLFNANGGDYLRREYDYLRREYEDLRRPFTVTADVPYTDVWTFPTVGDYPGKHPCEKPLAMMEHIVRASSRPGDTVLDCFAGSGVTGQACKVLGRSFVGIDADAHWVAQARRRLDGRLPLPTRQTRATTARATQGDLFTMESRP